MANSTDYPRIDYAARDFLMLKIALEDFIKSRFPNDYNDFTESNMGVMLLELCAWVGDMLSMSLDIQANESYLSTAKQRSNVLNIVKLIGYEPKAPSAASMELEGSVETVFPAPAIMKAGTSVSVEGVIFELLEDYTFPANTTVVGPNTDLEGPVFAEGTTTSDTYTGNNDSFQSYKLTQSPVIRNSVSVYVNGIQWEEVSALVYAGNTGSYAVEFTGNEESIIRFGNGISGRKPQLGDVIEVSYRIGGGTKGNIAANMLNGSAEVEIQTSPITPGTVTLTNPLPSTGGEDEESIESIKFNAPRYVRTHGNAITKEDYDTLSSLFSDPTYGSVAKAVAYPRYGKTNSSANEVDIWVWARGENGLEAPSLGIKAALLQYLNKRKVVTVDLFVNDGTLVPIDVQVDLYLSLGIKRAYEVVETVRTTIEAWFNRDALQPAQAFYVSELYREIMSVPGVLQCNIGIPGSPIAVAYNVEVDQIVIHGVTTDVRVKVPTYIPNPAPSEPPMLIGGLDATYYSSGTFIPFTGNIASKRFMILNNYKNAGQDYLRVDGDLSGLAVGDIAVINAQLTPLRDIPVADNEIYKLGNLTLNPYVRIEDTRETVVVENI